MPGQGGFTQARFKVGDEVVVLDLANPGHVRIPYYVRNKRGRVVQHCGIYLNPEDLAVGRTSGPAVNLYRVAFEQSHLWPDAERDGGDTLITEIYEHWLAPAPDADEAG